MAIRSGFFNSVNGDRKYDAKRFAEYFATFISNGVFPNPSTNLQVMANNDMTVTVKVGKAWINGYILINDDDYILELDAADGVLNRIDRIVARYDVANREITLEVKKGTFASSPVPKELQRDADAYELALADILVSNGVISITQANITDLRLNSDVCGIVHGLVDQVDTTTIFNQYRAWFNSVKDGTEQEIADWQQQQYDDFMIWFQSIQDILEGDVAANLASRISNLENDFTSHLAESTQQAHLAKNIGLEDIEGNFVATNIEGAMQELFTNVSNGKELVGRAITDVDDSVVIPTDPTFQQLVNAIGQISTGRKWASGVGSSSGSLLTVTGLDFEPSYVIVVMPIQVGTSTIITAINNSKAVFPAYNYPVNDGVDLGAIIGVLDVSGEAYRLYGSFGEGTFTINTKYSGYAKYWVAFE